MLLNTTGTSGETRTAYSSGALGWGSCCSTRLVQVVKQELLTLLDNWVGFMLLNTTGTSGERRTAYSFGALV